MPRIVVIFLSLICVVGALFAYLYWPSNWGEVQQQERNLPFVNREQEIKDLQHTKDLLNSGRAEDAVAIIERYSDEVHSRSDLGKEWLDQLIRASEATHNSPQLVILYEYYPKALYAHEKAAILVANAYLAEGRSQDYLRLRNEWKGRETKPETWFVLDGDSLLLDNKRKEAIDFLNSHTFSGKADTARLTRLALLNIFENPKVAWDYLSQAYAKDPANSEILSYRGKLLETFGKNSLALKEYGSALKTDPKNLFLKDQLADFYLRQKQYEKALEIWSENLRSPSLDSIWIKAIFWNKMAQPLEFDWKGTTPPQSKYEPYIEYLLSLKKGVFWNDSTFEKVPYKQELSKNQQPIFWLKLLSLLKQNKEKEALDLLQYNPFQAISWNIKLEETLKTILHYRKSGTFLQEKGISSEEGGSTQEDPLYFAQLKWLTENPNTTVPASLHKLLTSETAFTAALLAAGWKEAALQFNTLTVIPASYPDWIALELAQALRSNRGEDASLEFATQQHLTTPLSLLTGELLVSTGKPHLAIKYLKNLAYENTPEGYKAAWLLALVYIERGEYEEAKLAVDQQPTLKNDILGQELLARIALLEGEIATADQLYEHLESVSPEAQSYLARKAYADKNWPKAKELTELLIKQYPDNSLLHENLKKIIDEQNKAKFSL